MLVSMNENASKLLPSGRLTVVVAASNGIDFKLVMIVTETSLLKPSDFISLNEKKDIVKYRD